MKQGEIHELESGEVPTTAARAYLKALKHGRSTLMVSPTWNEIEVITRHVRGALKDASFLAGEEHTVHVFDSLSWTQAEKAHTRHYRPGLTLRFHKSKGRFKSGESVGVVQIGEDALTVRHSNGSETTLTLSAGFSCFDVGTMKPLPVAPGERLLLQANADRKRFINGELVTVKAFENGCIALNDGRTLPKDYNAFTHGYAVTSHAAQSKTVDEVLLVASSRSLAAVHQQQFYVSISRGREHCQIFTDDTDRLRAHAVRPNIRTAALEAAFIGELNPPRSFLQSLCQQAIHLTRVIGQRLRSHLTQKGFPSHREIHLQPRKRYEAIRPGL